MGVGCEGEVSASGGYAFCRKKLWLAPEKRQRGLGRKNEHQTGLTRLMARDLGRRTGDTHKCTSRLFKDLHS